MDLLYRMKLSAVHNLIVQESHLASFREGLLLPKSVMNAADLHEYEQIIVTRIRGGSVVNRIRTIALTDDCCDSVIACGSLSKFLNVGDLTCIISEAFLSKDELDRFNHDGWSIIDVGFDPNNNSDNHNFSIELQYRNRKEQLTKNYIKDDILSYRRKLMRSKLSSLIYGLIINKTHPNCLQGSAEIPASILAAANIPQYSSVSVYNTATGGLAETYAVAMPEGIVMTTGAMESFAGLGECVNVATFELTNHSITPCFCQTNGVAVINDVDANVK